MVTVYLDTCFYVWLARLDDDEAQDTIDRLNACRARLVLSQRLFIELAGNISHAKRNAVLVKRLQHLCIPPLITEPHLRWSALAVSETEAASIERIRTQAARAQAMSIAADAMSAETAKSPPRSRGPEPDWRNPPFDPVEFRSFLGTVFGQLRGVLDDVSDAHGNLTGVADLRALLDFIESKARELDEASDAVEIAAAMEPVAERARAIREDLAVAYPGLDAEGKIQSALMAKDNRITALGRHELANSRFALPNFISEGLAPDPGPLKPKTFDRLVGGLGDVSHMHTFAMYRRYVDGFQLDRRQYELLDRTSAGKAHFLVQTGLRGRCFRARNIDEAVKAVESIADTAAQRVQPPLSDRQVAVIGQAVSAIGTALAVGQVGCSAEIFIDPAGAESGGPSAWVQWSTNGPTPPEHLALSWCAGIVSRYQVFRPNDLETAIETSDFSPMLNELQRSTPHGWQAILETTLDPTATMAAAAKALQALDGWIMRLMLCALADSEPGPAKGVVRIRVLPAAGELGFVCPGIGVPADPSYAAEVDA